MDVRFREPSLGELLKDPLVRLLMASDGVTDTTMRTLISRVRPERRAPRDGNGNNVAYGVAPIGPAVANAVFTASRKRHRALPF